MLLLIEHAVLWIRLIKQMSSSALVQAKTHFPPIFTDSTLHCRTIFLFYFTCCRGLLSHVNQVSGPNSFEVARYKYFEIGLCSPSSELRLNVFYTETEYLRK